jgi:hypothetical protein
MGMTYSDRERTRRIRAAWRDERMLRAVLLALLGVEIARLVLDTGHYLGWW